MPNVKEVLQILLIIEEFPGSFISLSVYCEEFLRKGDFGCWDQCRNIGNLELVGLYCLDRPPWVEGVLEDAGLELSRTFIEREVG